jgi:hypothetical protein
MQLESSVVYLSFSGGVVAHMGAHRTEQYRLDFGLEFLGVPGFVRV